MEKQILRDSKGNELKDRRTEAEEIENGLNKQRAKLFRRKIWDVCDHFLELAYDEEDPDKKWSLVASVEKLLDVSANLGDLHE